MTSKSTRTFLNIPSAAEYIDKSERQLRRYIREGDIKIMRVGLKFFVLRRDLDTWLEKRGKSNGR